jgi:DNA-binding XRE family transcriptional regulator
VSLGFILLPLLNVTITSSYTSTMVKSASRRQTLDNHLRQLRSDAHLAQAGLAVRAGVSPSVIVAVEKWGYRPSERVRERIAGALDCSERDIWPNVESAR